MDDKNIYIAKDSKETAKVYLLQQKLREAGFDSLVTDGVFGFNTQKAVLDFQKRNGLTQDGIVGYQTWTALMGGANPLPQSGYLPASLNIKQLPLPNYCYNQSVVPKKQIVLHHTAGGPSAQPVFNHFRSLYTKVATAFVVERGGDNYQLFDDSHWAWHLGVEANDRVTHFSPYLDAESIAIELCNWGFLSSIQERRYGARPIYKNYVQGQIPEEDVCVLAESWRGQTAFESYSPAQILSTMKLVKALAEKHKIPLGGDYTEAAGWFDINPDALGGTPGLWNHTNFRIDKTDLSPQPAMIAELKKLKNIYA